MKARLSRKLFPEIDDHPPLIGRYRVVRRVGVGGMGEVFEAFDERLSRSVAIKTLHADLGFRHRTRLRREATALANLSHPAIAHAYEIGDHEGQLFLAMEFVDGETLRQWQRREDVSWRQILAKYLDAARGLAAAHERGIVHRDFKPANVMVRPDGRVCVLDFGLARRADGPGQHGGAAPDTILSEAVTITGSTIGTPAYMAPEQMLGQPVSPASDQFSFCVALWEAMFGMRPFRAGSSRALLGAYLNGPTPTVPRRPWRPAWLGRALLRGLQVAPERRHRSLDALIDALETPPKRRRTVSLAAGTLAVLAGIAHGRGEAAATCPDTEARLQQVTGPDARQARAEAFAATAVPYADRALEQVEARLTDSARAWSNAYARACETAAPDLGAATASRHARLACAERQWTELRETSELLGHADASVLERLPWIMTQLEAPPNCPLDADPTPDDAVQRTEIRRRLAAASVQLAAGHHERAARLASEAKSRSEQIDAAALRAESSLVLGRIHTDRDLGAEASAQLRLAAEEALAAGRDVTVFDAWIERADASLRLEQFELTETLVGQAHALLAEVEPSAGPRAARLALLEARYATRRNDFDRAFTRLDAAARLTEATFGASSLEMARVWRAKGDASIRAADPRTAADHYREARAIVDGLYGPGFPFGAELDYALGTSLLGRGELPEAIARFEAARAVFSESSENFALLHAQTLVALGHARNAVDEPEAALAALDDAEALVGDRLPRTHQLRLNIVTIRQDAFIALDRQSDLAESCAEAAVVYAELGRWDAYIGSQWTRLDALLRLDRADEALALANRELEELSGRFGADDPILLPLVHGLVAASRRLGDVPGASAALARADRMSAAEPGAEPVIEARLDEERVRLAQRRHATPAESCSLLDRARRAFERAGLAAPPDLWADAPACPETSSPRESRSSIDIATASLHAAE